MKHNIIRLKIYKCSLFTSLDPMEMQNILIIVAIRLSIQWYQ